MPDKPQDAIDPEPRWPAVLALLAVAGLRLALPDALSVGPNWLLLVVLAVLLVPTVLSHRMRGNHSAESGASGYVLNCGDYAGYGVVAGAADRGAAGA